MDTIPLFLQLIQSNTLLFSVIMTGNIHAFADNYTGKCYYPTELGVELLDFKLSENDVFDVVNIYLLPDSTINLAMFTSNAKYYEDPETYFGKETIYAEVADFLNERGIKPKHPFSYIFRNFEPPVFILSELAVTGYYIALSFGEPVLQMRVIKKQ